jgi:hypothetical protein
MRVIGKWVSVAKLSSSNFITGSGRQKQNTDGGEVGRFSSASSCEYS